MARPRRRTRHPQRQREFHAMASAKQIAANRINAGKTAGPKTSRGKGRASQNARRHGLDAVADSITTERVSRMADAITGENPRPLEEQLAIEIAECQVLISRVRAARVEAIE